MRLTDLERIRLELFWPLNGSSSRSLNSPLTLIETLIEIGGGHEQDFVNVKSAALSISKS